MKNLIFAFFAALIAIVVSYFVLTSIGVDKTIATSISTVILSGIPFIHQTLIKNESKKSNTRTSQFVPFNKFTYDFKLSLIYAFMLFFAALNFTSVLGGMLIEVLGANPESTTLVIGILAVFIMLPLFFLIGRWIGIKSSSSGIIVTVLAVILSRIATSIFDYSLLSAESFEKFLGEKPTISFFLFQTVIGGALLSVVALAGYWRGRKRQLVAYLGYLMARVHEDIRNTIIELAFEEAEKSENNVI